jgi:fatty acid synthase subunit alpha, fungi type
VTIPTAPRTVVIWIRMIKYSEVVHDNVSKLEAYVQEMSSGDSVSGNVNIQKLQDGVWK